MSTASAKTLGRPFTCSASQTLTVNYRYIITQAEITQDTTMLNVVVTFLTSADVDYWLENAAFAGRNPDSETLNLDSSADHHQNPNDFYLGHVLSLQEIADIAHNFWSNLASEKQMNTNKNRTSWMSLVSVNLTLILNYQVHCGLIALRRLMLNMPPTGTAL